MTQQWFLEPADGVVAFTASSNTASACACAPPPAEHLPDCPHHVVFREGATILAGEDVPLEISFEVLGTPAPKGSARPMLNRKTGKPFTFAGGSRATEIKLQSWDSNVRAAALQALGERTEPLFVQVPLELEIEFRLARPSSHWGAKGLKPSAPRRPSGRPDIDKVARSTLDSLTNLVFDDDSRVVTLVLRKVYAQPGREGARITIREAT